MEFFFIFLAIGAVVALIIPFAIAHARQTDESWSATARALGLEFRPGSLLRSRQISGSIDGHRVLIDIYSSGGRHPTTYTRFRVKFRRPLGLGLRLRRDGLLSGVAKMFGAQDIRVGAAAFDRRVLVKGRPPRKVLAFLTEARRTEVYRTILAFPGVVIDDRQIFWRKPGIVRHRGVLDSTVHRFVRLASSMCGDGERPQPAGSEIHPGESRSLREGRRPDEAAIAAEATTDPATDPAAAAAPPVEPIASRLFPPDVAPPSAWRPFDGAAPDLPGADDTRAVDRLDGSVVCEDLFGSGNSTLETNRIFEARYQDRKVHWRGRLARVEGFSYDYIFGDAPGTRMVIDLHEIDTALPGARPIQAVVRLPPDAEESLRSRSGESLAFAGRLIQADGLMRCLYVADGRLE